MAEIDDVHIDLAAAAERCIEGGTCKLSKLSQGEDAIEEHPYR